VIAYFDQLFRGRPLAYWTEWLSDLDVCFGPVQTFPEALADPQLLARGMVVTDGNGRKHISTPIHFVDEPAQIDLHTPHLGQDSEAITGIQKALEDQVR
jgi:crotonobetainyl-CoA:carnitine CoA-transferase CaiB-like acyl-CoA transferase